MSYQTALIDGSGFAKAAYEVGKRSLSHRFLLRVYKLLTEEPGIDITVCWDPADNVSERVKRFPDYKKSRRRLSTFLCDEQYQGELRELFEILPHLGVAQAWADGWEADDVLGTLARTSPKPVLVLTRDGDMVQLVQEDVHVLFRRGSKEKVYTPKGVLKERGIPAELLTDWKALAGDSGDDVPGMPGIGAKTATEILVERPSTVKAILNRANPLTPEDLVGDLGLSTRTTNLLRKAAADPERLRTMRWLVDLHDVAPTFRRARRDYAEARRLMKRVGLRTLSVRIKELPGSDDLGEDGGGGDE